MQERHTGRADAQALLTGLERSAVSRHRASLALAWLECVDLDAGRAVLELAREEIPDGGGGLFDVARSLSQARLERDPQRLLAGALALERAGALTPALRALADVTRLSGREDPVGRLARGSLIRVLRPPA